MTHIAPKLSPLKKKPTSLRLINTIEGFESLQNDWDGLYDKCERSSIFSSWDWMFTWWEVFKDQYDRELFILALYQENELVGLAPFQICTPPAPKSLIQGKTLYFIGNGEALGDSIISEFQDFIVSTEHESEMIRLVSEYLIKHNDKWNFADFEFLLKDALILQCFDSSSRNRHKISRYNMEYGVRFTIPQMDSFEQYLEILSKSRRKLFLKNSKKLSRDGEVTTVATESLDSINTSLTLLAEMVCERWGDSTGKCIFDSIRFMEFHQKILARLIPQKRATIVTMYLGDEVVASNYMFMDKKQIHGYQVGFQKKHSNKYSPVFVMICKKIEESISSNSMFDFMFADDVNSYKKEHFSCDHEPMYRLRWSSQKYRLPLFHSAKYAQNTIMSIKQTLQEKLDKKRGK